MPTEDTADLVDLGRLEEISDRESAYWLREERLAAVRDIVECSGDCVPVDDFVEVLRTSIGTQAASVSFLAKGCVLRQQHTYREPGGLSKGNPDFCFWTLVPEKPQVLVIEDARQDARTCNSKMVTQHPFVRSYAAAPLVTSSGERIGTLCVLDPRCRTFSQEEVALICNFAELIMRMLEGQVMQKRPQSSILKNKHQRRPEAYQQSFAIVRVVERSWQIAASTLAFDEMTGLDRRERDVDMWSLFKDIQAQQKAMKKCSLGRMNSELRVDGLVPHSKDYSLSAVMLKATNQFDPSRQLIGIPCLFARQSSVPEVSDSKVKHLYIVLVAPHGQPLVHKASLEPPIPNLQLQRPLGAGAYAKVYRGTYNGTKVAVKVVHEFGEEMAEDESAMEATSMEAVHHPALLRLHEWKVLKNSKNKTRLWLVVELCDKGNIAEAIDEGQFRTSPNPKAPLNEFTIAVIFKELASGLKALHDGGILHCDISGGNVMLQSSEDHPHRFSVKIGDFGLSQRIGSAATRQFAGSYTYLAPEVLREGLISKASDIYSLGVLFHEILCGERAWGGLHHSQVYFSLVIRKETLQWPKDIPSGLKHIAVGLLMYEPQERCSLETALQLIEDELKRQGQESE